MENDNIDIELPELPVIREDEEDTIDWKAEAAKAHGIAKRFKTKFEKAKSAPQEKVEESKPVKKEGFGYEHLAYLAAKGISDEDISYVEETVKATGKELRDLLATDWFKKDLKERKEVKAAKEAIPTATNRSNTTSRDNVDYWLAKGELPPSDQPALRRQVLNARIKSEGSKSQFTDRPVA